MRHDHPHSQTFSSTPTFADPATQPPSQKANTSCSQTTWSDTARTLSILMDHLSVRDRTGCDLGEAGLYLLKWITLETGRLNGCVFFAGNGASASMASHFSADLSKNAQIRTMVFTDPALLTAVSNDHCYADVFAVPLSWHMTDRDMLVLISSSGNSNNVLRAAAIARQKGGRVVTLSAMAPDNALRGLGDVNVYVPAQTYGHAETIHAAVLHHWLDTVVQATPPSGPRHTDGYHDEV